MAATCKCGKGKASNIDGLCRFCREAQFPRAEAKRVGVRHRADGMSLFQAEKLRRG